MSDLTKYEYNKKGKIDQELLSQSQANHHHHHHRQIHHHHRPQEHPTHNELRSRQNIDNNNQNKNDTGTVTKRMPNSSRNRTTSQRRHHRRRSSTKTTTTSTTTGLLDPPGISLLSNSHSRRCGGGCFLVCGLILFFLLQLCLWIAIDQMDNNDINNDDINNDNNSNDDDNDNDPILIDDDQTTYQRYVAHHGRWKGIGMTVGSLLFQIIQSTLQVPYQILQSILYYLSGTRTRHTKRLQSYETTYFEHDQKHLPVVIIGGTDGSGTRAVVDLLRELGAMIVADDVETFDVHAGLLYGHRGWPGLVQAVLNQTNGRIDYDYYNTADTTTTQDDVFDPIVRQKIDKEVKNHLVLELQAKFEVDRRSYRRKYAMRRLREDNNGGDIGNGDNNNDAGVRFRPDRRRHVVPASKLSPLTAAMRNGGIQGRPTIFAGLAKDVSYVIKAPVSMLLWPILVGHMASPIDRRIKILHVIRDGRDIALSQNQSPVVKFFNLTYPQDYNQLLHQYSGELEPVRGMKLWSDWNTQAMQWATKYASKTKTKTTKTDSTSSVKLEYLWVRSEDLLPGSPSRRQVIQAMAEFVGSTLTNDQLCCLSSQKIRDYGKSVTHNAETMRRGKLEAQNNTAEASPGFHQFLNRWRDQEEERTNVDVDGHEKLHRHHRGHQRGPFRGGGHGGGHGGQFDHRKLQQQQQNLLSTDDLAALKFLKDVENWRTLANTTFTAGVNSGKVLAIQGLMDHGYDLLNGLKQNKKMLRSMGSEEIDSSSKHTTMTTKREILDMIERLRTFQEEVRRNKFHVRQANRQGDANVTRRFGKWHTIFDNQTNANLVAHMYDAGSSGLGMFGYHPERTIDYATSFTFNDTISLCLTTDFSSICPGLSSSSVE